MADYNRNATIGGFKGEPIKGSMLGKNLKSRGFVSNNLPFRQAEGLAPYNEYGFLFPTGTEAGAVWRFGSSGEEYQDSNGLQLVTATGQGIGAIFDYSRPQGVNQVSQPNGQNLVAGGTQVPIVTPNTAYLGKQCVAVTFNTNGVGGYGVSNATSPTEGSQSKISLLSFEIAVSRQLTGSEGFQLYQQSPAGNYSPNYTAANSAGMVNTWTTVSGIMSSTASGPVNWAIYANGTFTGVPFTVYIRNVSIKEINLPLTQATATSRPLTAIESVGGWNQSVYSGRFDGIDDQLISANFVAGTLSNNMDFFCAIKRNTANIGIPMQDPNGAGVRYFGAFDPLTVGVQSDTGAGNPLYFVDGIQISGIHGDRSLLAAALTVNNWHVLEIRGLDLSIWTAIAASGYAGWFINANLGDVVICPAQSNAVRQQIRTLVGASVGLNL